MPARPASFILDSWSVMAFLEGEPASQQVTELLVDAHEKNIPVLISVVNAAEIWYLVARCISDADADRTISRLEEMGVALVEADWSLALGAARFKSGHKISLGDAFAAALAQVSEGVLVTGDPQFKQLEGQIRVLWL
ncbi:MAG: type II toxin-antitoxin system VapC family toxin [Chloroflexi bacterium]|nr:type II toxin-antitoxin system VapC family toxin [Chloroflexota bacterium]